MTIRFIHTQLFQFSILVCQLFNEVKQFTEEVILIKASQKINRTTVDNVRNKENQQVNLKLQINFLHMVCLKAVDFSVTKGN